MASKIRDVENTIIKSIQTLSNDINKSKLPNSKDLDKLERNSNLYGLLSQQKLNQQFNKFSKLSNSLDQSLDKMLGNFSNTAVSANEVDQLIQDTQSEIQDTKINRRNNLNKLSPQNHQIATRDIEARLQKLKGPTATTEEIEARLKALKSKSAVSKIDNGRIIQNKTTKNSNKELIRAQKEGNKKAIEKEQSQKIDLRKGAMETIDFKKSYYDPSQDNQKIKKSQSSDKQKRLEESKIKLKNYYLVLAKRAQLNQDKTKDFLDKHHKRVDQMKSFAEIVVDKKKVFKAYQNIKTRNNTKSQSPAIKNNISQSSAKTQQTGLLKQRTEENKTTIKQNNNNNEKSSNYNQKLNQQQLKQQQELAARQTKEFDIAKEKRRLKDKYFELAKSLRATVEQKQTFLKSAYSLINNSNNKDHLDRLEHKRLEIIKNKNEGKSGSAIERLAKLKQQTLRRAEILKAYNTGQVAKQAKNQIKSINNSNQINNSNKKNNRGWGL